MHGKDLASIAYKISGFFIGLDYNRSRTKAWNHRERLREQITRRENFKDSDQRLSAKVGYRITKKLQIEFSIEQLAREGFVNSEYNTQTKETVRRIILRYLF